MKFPVKIHLLIASSILSILSFSSIYTATITVKNSSKSPIHFTLISKGDIQHNMLFKPGQTRTLSTGFNEPRFFGWEDISNNKFYKHEKTIPALSTGGFFEVKNNGNYYYYFPLEGEEERGQAKEAVDLRKSMAIDPRESLKDLIKKTK